MVYPRTTRLHYNPTPNQIVISPENLHILFTKEIIKKILRGN